jgi:hypothetical protein
MEIQGEKNKEKKKRGEETHISHTRPAHVSNVGRNIMT